MPFLSHLCALTLDLIHSIVVYISNAFHCLLFTFGMHSIVCCLHFECISLACCLHFECIPLPVVYILNAFHCMLFTIWMHIPLDVVYISNAFHCLLFTFWMHSIVCCLHFECIPLLFTFWIFAVQKSQLPACIYITWLGCHHWRLYQHTRASSSSSSSFLSPLLFHASMG